MYAKSLIVSHPLASTESNCFVLLSIEAIDPCATIMKNRAKLTGDVGNNVMRSNDSYFVKNIGENIPRSVEMQVVFVYHSGEFPQRGAYLVLKALVLVAFQEVQLGQIQPSQRIMSKF